jgi:hypothetical protein
MNYGGGYYDGYSTGYYDGYNPYGEPYRRGIRPTSARTGFYDAGYKVRGEW